MNSLLTPEIAGFVALAMSITQILKQLFFKSEKMQKHKKWLFLINATVLYLLVFISREYPQVFNDLKVVLFGIGSSGAYGIAGDILKKSKITNQTQ